MKNRYKTKRVLRINIKEVPTKLKLNDDARKNMKFKDYIQVNFLLNCANELMKRGVIKEPGTYDIDSGWDWKRPTKYWFDSRKVK